MDTSCGEKRFSPDSSNLEKIKKSIYKIYQDELSDVKVDKSFVYLDTIISFQDQTEDNISIVVNAYDLSGQRFPLSIEIRSLAYFELSLLPPYCTRKEQLEEGINLIMKEFSDSYIKHEIFFSQWLNHGLDEHWWTRVYFSDIQSMLEVVSKCKDISGFHVSDQPGMQRMKERFYKISSQGLQFFCWAKIKTGNVKHKHSLEDFDWNSPETLPFLESLPKPHTIMYYDFEVYNSNLMSGVKMPDILDMDCYINSCGIDFRNSLKKPLSFALNVVGKTEIKSIKEEGEEEFWWISLQSQKELLIVMLDLIELFAPAFMIDYNGLGFDQKWFLSRCDVNSLTDRLLDVTGCTKFSKRTLTAQKEGKTKSEVLFSRYIYGESLADQKSSIQTSYICHLDMMQYILRNKLCSTQSDVSLDAVAAHHGIIQKISVEHSYVSILTTCARTLCASNKEETWIAVMKKLNKAISMAFIAQSDQVLRLIEILKGRVLDLVLNLFDKTMIEYGFYCLRDARICTLLDEKLGIVDSTIAQAKLCSVHPCVILYNGVMASVGGYLEYMTQRDNTPFHTYKEADVIKFNQKIANLKILGGITLEVLPQDFDEKWITWVLDMSSYYPSVMIDFNISPDAITFNPPNDRSYLEIDMYNSTGKFNSFFVRQDKPGFVARMQKELIAARAKIKAAIKECNKDEIQKKKNLRVSELSVKRLTVSIYGATATSKAQQYIMYNPCAGTATTQICAQLLELVALDIFNKYGLVPIMGVTDSLAYKADPRWLEAMGLDGSNKQLLYEMTKIFSIITERSMNEVIQKLVYTKCYTKIALEHITSSLCCKQRKRYAMRVLKDSCETIEEAHEKGRNKIVGYTQIRSNASEYIKIFSKDLDDNILSLNSTTSKDIFDITKNAIQEAVNDPGTAATRQSFGQKTMSMKYARGHMFVGYQIGAYPPPPGVVQRVSILHTDYSCRHVLLTGKMNTHWTSGYLLMPLTHIKEMGLPVNKRRVVDETLSFIEEKLGKEGVGFEVLSSIKAMYKKETPIALDAKSRRALAASLSLAVFPPIQPEEKLSFLTWEMITDVGSNQSLSKFSWKLCADIAKKKDLSEVIQHDFSASFDIYFLTEISTDEFFERVIYGLAVFLGIMLSKACAKSEVFLFKQDDPWIPEIRKFIEDFDQQIIEKYRQKALTKLGIEYKQ